MGKHIRMGSTKVLPTRPTNSESFHFLTCSHVRMSEIFAEKATQLRHVGIFRTYETHAIVYVVFAINYGVCCNFLFMGVGHHISVVWDATL